MSDPTEQNDTADNRIVITSDDDVRNIGANEDDTPPTDDGYSVPYPITQR